MLIETYGKFTTGSSRRQIAVTWNDNNNMSFDIIIILVRERERERVHYY